MIHLDTNFLIRSLLPNTPEATRLDTWVAAGEDIGISAIAWCEFLCGPVDATAAATALLVLGTPVNFLGDDATRAADFFNATGRRRGSLTDCMIAAVALRSGAVIATNNIDDFRILEPMGLTLAAAP